MTRLRALVVASLLALASAPAVPDDEVVSDGPAGPTATDAEGAPTYAGRPVSFWLDELRPAATRRIAEEVLLHLGERALAGLVASLAEPDVEVRRSIATLVVKCGGDLAPHVPRLAESLADSDRVVVVRVLQALQRAGPAAAPAADAVAERLDVKAHDVRSGAALALGASGEAARPHVRRIAALLTDSKCRGSAIAALTSLGPNAAEALQDVLAAESSFGGKSRGAWTNALLTIAPTDPRVVAVARSGLDSDDVKAKCAALGLLGRCAAAGAGVEDEIVAALSDEAGPVRNAAAQALRALGERARPFVPQLLAALGDVEAKAARDAFALLDALGALDESAVPALVRAGAARNRTEVLARLESFGPKAAPGLLAVLTGDAPAAERTFAADHLGWIGDPAVRDHGDALRRFVLDEEAPAEARTKVLQVLARAQTLDAAFLARARATAGEELRPTVDALLLVAPDAPAWAARALSTGGEDRVTALDFLERNPLPDLVPAVELLLADPDRTVRRRAATILIDRRTQSFFFSGPSEVLFVESTRGFTRHAGPDAPETDDASAPTPAAFGETDLRLAGILVDALLDEDADVRGWAVSRIALLPAAAVPAVPPLGRMLSDRVLEMRRLAADGLGTFAARGDPSARRELDRAATSHDPHVRAAAFTGLGHATHDAGVLVPLLLDVLRSLDAEDPEDRWSLHIVLAAVPVRAAALATDEVVGAVARLTQGGAIGDAAASALVALAACDGGGGALALEKLGAIWDEAGAGRRIVLAGRLAVLGERGGRLLASALSSGSRDVRHAALQGLQGSGAAPSALRPRIEELTEDTDPEIANLAKAVLAAQPGR